MQINDHALVFKKSEDVFNLPKFKFDTSISSKNYANIYAEYHTLGMDMKCCCQKQSKKGNRLCGSEHRHGFVIRLQCGTLSLLGSTCITEFDKDAKIHKDQILFKRKLDAQQNEKRLHEFLSNKDSLLTEINFLELRVKQIFSIQNDLVKLLGEEVSNKIKNMAKTKDPILTVLGVNIREYIDDEGQERTETHKAKVRISTIKGLDTFDPYIIRKIQSEIGDYKRALKKGEDMAQKSNFKGVEKLLNTLSKSPDKTSAEIDMIEAAILKFETDNRTFVCYLTNDSTTKKRIVKNYLELNNLPSSQINVKQYIFQEKEELLKKYKLTKIEVL